MSNQVNVGNITLRENELEGVIEMTSDITGVVLQNGLEDWVRVYNDTGLEIANGTPVIFNGTHTDGTSLIALAGASTQRKAIAFAGLLTSTIANGAYGFATSRGKVRGLDTSGFSFVGPIYLSAVDGELVQVPPVYPNYVILIGGVDKIDAVDGVITVQPSLGLLRQVIAKSDNFTSNGIAAGAYYKFGFYEVSAADANLTQASLTQTFGTADIGYSAHPFAVAGGAGTVDTGVVGLQISGTSITDDGVLTPADTEIIIPDITAVALNTYVEGKKFVGTVTYTLVVISGSPVNFSFDFNYGYAKYEDFGNRDFYIAGIECVWQGGATDATGFNIKVLHHSTAGWTYSAAAFVAGGTVIAERAVDQAGFLGVLGGVDSAWKRTDLDTFIDGSGSEGIVMEISTGANGSIQTMDMHLGAALD